MKLIKRTIDLLNENIKLANQYQDLLISQGKALELWKSKEQMHTHLLNLHAEEDKLNLLITKII